MEKPNCYDSELADRTASPPPPPPPPLPLPPVPLPHDFDMNWQTTLSQSDSNIHPRPNQSLTRLSTTFHNPSYKVSIGHETVNITEIARQRKMSSNPSSIIVSDERRRVIAARKNANILSLCFMCFVSACLILIAISLMSLLSKTHSISNNDLLSSAVQSTNFTPGQIYILATSSTDTITNLILPIYDRTIRDLATVVCLLIVVLNCFCLLVFSMEIYLGCNILKSKDNLQQSFSVLFSTSTSRFLAICSFYASIPALILVMCLFILLNMSLIPAIISLIILGCGLIFILFTLLTYFSTTNQRLNSNMYQSVTTKLQTDDDIDILKADELSTLV